MSIYRYLDILPKIKENHIDFIAEVSEQKTALLHMKKPTKNRNKEIRHFDCSLYFTSDTTQLFQKMYFHV